MDGDKPGIIKEGQEHKHMDKRFRLSEGVYEDIPHQMESKGATEYDGTYIPRKVWDEWVCIKLPHGQYLVLEIKINNLEKTRNVALCY